MINFNKEKKVINDYINYIESWYLDILNEEAIEIYSIQAGLSEEEKEILERRFL